MKRNLLLSILVICSPLLVMSQPITWDWAHGMGGKQNYDGTVDLAKDAQGNLYVMGDFTGTKNFGPFTLFATGFNEIFVAKYDNLGNCQWAIKGGANFSSAYAGGLTINGNTLFITGRFANNINIGGQFQQATGGDDIFIASLDPSSGSCNWVNKAGGAINESPGGIAPENGGGFLLTGSFQDAVTFGTITLNSNNVNNIDIFLAKYDASGNCSWAVKAGSPAAEDRGLSIKQLSGGGIFLTGYFQQTATFGPSTTVTAVGGYEFFLARYDGSGNIVWVQKGGGNGSDIGYGIGADAAGNIYVAGFIGDTATFGGITVFDNEYGSIMIAKYSNSGTPQWVKTASSISDDSAFDIAVDAAGSSYVTGYISNNATFSGNAVTGVQGNDAFAAKYDALGNIKWVTRMGGTFFDRGKSIVADVGGYCYVAGEFYGTVNFGTHPATSSINEWSVYLARLGGGTVGIENKNEMPFSFYPNPASESVTLNLSKIKDDLFSIDIISTDGKLILSKVVNQNEVVTPYILNLQHIAIGNYLLQINTSTGTFSTPLNITR